jgi:hypothetical protein
MTSSGIESATFRLVAQCPNQLCCCVLEKIKLYEKMRKRWRKKRRLKGMEDWHKNYDNVKMSSGTVTMKQIQRDMWVPWWMEQQILKSEWQPWLVHSGCIQLLEARRQSACTDRQYINPMYTQCSRAVKMERSHVLQEQNSLCNAGDGGWLPAQSTGYLVIWCRAQPLRSSTMRMPRAPLCQNVYWHLSS